MAVPGPPRVQISTAAITAQWRAQYQPAQPARRLMARVSRPGPGGKAVKIARNIVAGHPLGGNRMPVKLPDLLGSSPDLVLAEDELTPGPTSSPPRRRSL